MFVEYSRARRQRDVGRLPRRVRLSRIRAAGDRADRRRQRRHGHGPSNRRADLRRRRTRRVLLPERHAGPGQRCPDQRRQRGAAGLSVRRCGPQRQRSARRPGRLTGRFPGIRLRPSTHIQICRRRWRWRQLGGSAGDRCCPDPSSRASARDLPPAVGVSTIRGTWLEVKNYEASGSVWRTSSV